MSAVGLLRTFLAIDIPNGSVKDNVLGFMKTVSETGADLKPVEPENMHVTLRFLGDIRSSTVEELKTELNKIRFNQFDIALESVGVFPDYKRINVIWVGIGEDTVQLVDLYGKVNKALEDVGIPPDRRGLSPHITVARVRSGRNREALARIIEEREGTEFGKFPVSSFQLKKSTLTPQGPIYESLHEVSATLG